MYRKLNLKFIQQCLSVLAGFLARHYLLVAICFLSLFLRVWGINFGLPDFNFHSDESRYLAAIQSVSDSSVKSHYEAGLPFGSFFYLLFFFFSIYKKILIHLGGQDFLWWGRFLSAVISTASVFLTYFIGKRIFNKKTGLLSALMLSVFFVDALVGHYIKEDVYVQFFGLLSILFFILFVERKKIRHYALMILFIALASWAKLSGMFFALPFIFWIFSKNSRKENNPNNFLSRRLVAGLIFSVCLLGIIVISNPFAYREIARTSGVDNVTSVSSKIDFKKLMLFKMPGQTFSSDHDGILNYVWWPYYLMTSGFYYPLFFLVIFGLVYFSVGYKKGKNHLGTIYVILMAVAFYLFLSIQHNRFDRWITAITPLMAILAAAGVNIFWEKIRMNRALRYATVFIVGAVLLFSFMRIALFDFFISQSDTRAEARDWMAQNYSKQDPILMGQDEDLASVFFNAGYQLNTLELDNPRFFNFHDGIFIVSSKFYDPIINYRNDSDIKNKFKNYQILENNGSVIKEFVNPFFESGFFSPKALEIGSTVNYYHNPTIKIYKIPEVADSSVDFTYSYNVDSMIRFNPGLQKNKMAGALYFKKEVGLAQYLVGGPATVFPAGKFTLVYSLKTSDNKSAKEVAMISVAVAGSGEVLRSRPIRGVHFQTPDSYQDFVLEFYNPTVQRLNFNLISALPADLWVGGASLSERRAIVSETLAGQSDLKNNLVGKYDKWDVSADSGKDPVPSFEYQKSLSMNTEQGINLATLEKSWRLSLSYKDEKQIFGFSSLRYAGRSFTASAWIRADKPQCVRVGFYSGNNSAFGWGDYNSYGRNDKYEFIGYQGYFDAPYSQNGNLYLEIRPNCKVEIAKPAVILQ